MAKKSGIKYSARKELNFEWYNNEDEMKTHFNS